MKDHKLIIKMLSGDFAGAMYLEREADGGLFASNGHFAKPVDLSPTDVLLGLFPEGGLCRELVSEERVADKPAMIGALLHLPQNAVRVHETKWAVDGYGGPFRLLLRSDKASVLVNPHYLDLAPPNCDIVQAEGDLSMLMWVRDGVVKFTVMPITKQRVISGALPLAVFEEWSGPIPEPEEREAEREI